VKTVLCLVVVADDHILFTRNPEDGQWTGIAGSVAQGEDGPEAASRKAKEEAGLDVPRDAWVHRATVGDVGVYLARVAPMRAVAPPGQHPLILYPRSANWDREPVRPNLRWLIPFALSDSPAVEVPA